MKTLRIVLSILLFAAFSVRGSSTDLVILKGGARIELQKPPVRQGNVVLLTRSDGTLLSVQASEIDWNATAAARAPKAPGSSAPASVAVPETPAEAARAASRRPKARVKLTDADVSHPLEEATDSTDKEKKESRSSPARLEVADYVQEKTGANLVVRGTIRNPGGAPAAGARMTVSAMDEKGERIASGEASLSNALIDSGATASFSVTIPVGERIVASLRFSPQWIASAPPAMASTPAVGATPAASPVAPSAAPTPTPYGQGTLFAPPPAGASTTPPADDHRGYIPGMSSPENQPKPPK